MRLVALVSPTHNAMISIRARSTSVVTMACAFINLYRWIVLYVFNYHSFYFRYCYSYCWNINQFLIVWRWRKHSWQQMWFIAPMCWQTIWQCNDGDCEMGRNGDIHAGADHRQAEQNRKSRRREQRSARHHPRLDDSVRVLCDLHSGVCHCARETTWSSRRVRRRQRHVRCDTTRQQRALERHVEQSNNEQCTCDKRGERSAFTRQLCHGKLQWFSR